MAARSIDDLHAVSNALREQRVPILVIGRGSNLLVADEGFEGLVVVLGEFAEEGLLGGQRAVPAALERAGFTFHHKTLGEALAYAVGSGQ